MNLKKMMTRFRAFNGCMLYAGADKSNCSPRFLENPGIITKQYYITSKADSIGCYGSGI